MNVFKRLRQLKTLLVDDDEWIRDAMSIFFKSEGCAIQTLETAEEALPFFAKVRYDIVLIDYMLPGMNGICFAKALERLQADQPKCQSPIIKILITAHGEAEIITQAKATGFHDIIHKPFTPEDIEIALGKVL
ncbi:MAG: response regulator [Desulfobacterium sp.]|nr:response regulator [Desulfobacterium sp.]